MLHFSTSFDVGSNELLLSILLHFVPGVKIPFQKLQESERQIKTYIIIEYHLVFKKYQKINSYSIRIYKR